MSDTPQSDPWFDHLCRRKAELSALIADASPRLAEIEAMLATYGDGRTRVRRRLKEAPAMTLAIPEPPTPAAETGDAA